MKCVPAFMALLVTCYAPTAVAQLPPISTGAVQIRLERFATGLPVASGTFTDAGPTDLESIPNGSEHIVVTNFNGIAHVFDRNGNESATPFLNLKDPSSPTFSSNFLPSNANGLMALTFHPDYENVGSNGYGRFYTLEAERPGTGTPDFANSVRGFNHHRQSLYEYTMANHADLSCGVACAASKRRLFLVDQPGWHHNMGDLIFDQAGLLYISSGDGSTSDALIDPIVSDNSLLLTNVYGKILRIDPLGSNSSNGQYGIPASNPFVGGSALDEIYAYGLRNPYRMSFDPVSGDLYASETGEVSVESVERIVAGGHHGWNLKEGSFIYDKYTRGISEDVDADGNGIGDFAEANNLVEPALQYDHDEGDAIVGGVVYAGTQIQGLSGRYVMGDWDGLPGIGPRLFYGDTSTGVIHEFGFDDSGDAIPENILSINQDENGEIFILGVDFIGGQWQGNVTRVLPAITADFNDDGFYNCLDIDALTAEIAAATNDSQFDLTGDGLVDQSDLEGWLAMAGENNLGPDSAYLPGDANLDGVVDISDFNIWNMNKFSVANWCGGDFNASGAVDVSDFNIWNVHKFSAAQSIPEPSGLWHMAGWLFLILAQRRWTLR